MRRADGGGAWLQFNNLYCSMYAAEKQMEKVLALLKSGEWGWQRALRELAQSFFTEVEKQVLTSYAIRDIIQSVAGH